MGVHKGQCPRITGRKQCRGTLFPASIMGKKECRGTLFLASKYQEEESAGVHSFLPVNSGQRRVQGYTLSFQYKLDSGEQ